MSGKIENIQALRGIAALAVFVAHLVGAERDYGNGATLLPMWLEMGQSGVDLFFLISGYVMVHVAATLPRGRQIAARFLFNRAARIYPLYWIVTVSLLILLAGKKYLFGEDTPITNWVQSFLLLPSDGLPIVAVGWTLIHEMYFYLVFAGALLFTALKVQHFLLAWAVVLFAAIAAGLRDIAPWTDLVFNPLTYEFIVGCIIALLIHRGESRFALPCLITGVAVLSILVFGFSDQLFPHSLTDFGVRVLVYGPPYALILYGAVALEQQDNVTAPGWLIRMGDASYALYLVHIPVFLVVGKSLSLLGASGVLFNMALIAAFAASAIAASFAAHYFIEKPALSATKRLGARLFDAPAQKAVAADRVW